MGQASPSQSLPQALRRNRKRQEQQRQDKDHGNGVKTASPIKHVIVLIGENRGLDHTFGVYKPKGKGETISNLLSKGIVNEDGTPGPNFALAQQFSVAAQPSYYIGAPTVGKVALQPDQPDAAAEHQRRADRLRATPALPSRTIAEASVEKDIDPADLDILTTGATGLAGRRARHPHSRRRQPERAVPVAGSRSINDDDYTGDTTHRFYQDWQQDDCSVANATKSNTSGCLNDLFPFVMATYSPSNNSQGNSMGFYNAEQGEAPILKQLADRFTLGDNFHQSFHGGTGANHFMLGTGDAAFWSDGNGNPVDAAHEHDRQPEPDVGHGQPVHRRQQLHRLRRLHAAGRRADRQLSGKSALRGRTELPGQPLLHARQHQPRLSAERCAVGWQQPAAFAGSHHWRCSDRKEHHLGLLRRCV